MSPSGTEIRVGQVWEPVSPYTVTVREVDKKRGKVLITMDPKCGMVWVASSVFNGARGGYNLVKDVQP